jgi:hypothetical protein
MTSLHARLRLACLGLLLSVLAWSAATAGTMDQWLVEGQAAPNDFQLADAKHQAALWFDTNDFKVVHIAAGCLADDIELVTSRRPKLIHGEQPSGTQVVIIGTLGHSAPIDALVRGKKLDVQAIAGRWESSLITTIANPFPGVQSALVIAGSDRRGTAFGVFALSEAIGVSPWVWWADVAPQHRDSLTLRGGTRVIGSPSVKYRGIFLNDEDWGLHPWASKTFEPETGDIGPKTYARVCELLLRLKANYLWPAMHPCTRAFNLYPQNKQVADDYAIVMGSSHCEQMLCNNVSEYGVAKLGPWDYDKNQTNILAYWRQRLVENGKFENIYTIGMRGIHDSGMPGGGTTAQKTARLQRVIDDQRKLIAETIHPDPAQVPQIFCPYKEVMTLYQQGLRVPDDVTLVWPDDNHGYVRQLSNPAEQKRGGGAGVYYHISYWGAPEDYLWLCTTPPALIWEEMRKAYDHGARNVWVVNVGDIKPGEIGMEFFLRLAWDIQGWDESVQLTFLRDWAGRNFGAEHAPEIAAVLNEYYLLNHIARPEHLRFAGFTSNYDELSTRLRRLAQNTTRANAIYQKLPREKRDAFFELVLYPVRGSALANQMNLVPSQSEAMSAYNQLQTETEFYNGRVAFGKWRRMMPSNPRNRVSLQPPKPRSVAVVTNMADTAGRGKGHVSIAADHATWRTAGAGTAWKTIPGIGRSGSCVTLQPTTVPVPAAAALEFEFTAEQAVKAQVQVYCLPTHPIHPALKLRYAVRVGSGSEQIVDLATSEFSRPWSTNVLRAAAIGTTTHGVSRGGHTLKVRPLDPGLVFDKVVIDLGGLKPSHLGPPETVAASSR